MSARYKYFYEELNIISVDKTNVISRDLQNGIL